MDNRISEQIQQFSELFYYKGYRKQFELAYQVRTGPSLKGQLVDVLTEFLSDKAIESDKTCKFQLNTFAEYLSANDYRQCYLRVEYSPKNGFAISQMDLISRNPTDQRVFRLRRNEDLLPVQSAIGYFRRPKPWEDVIKGRPFRR